MYEKCVILVFHFSFHSSCLSWQCVTSIWVLLYPRSTMHLILVWMSVDSGLTWTSLIMAPSTWPLKQNWTSIASSRTLNRSSQQMKNKQSTFYSSEQIFVECLIKILKNKFVINYDLNNQGAVFSHLINDVSYKNWLLVCTEIYMYIYTHMYAYNMSIINEGKYSGNI